MTLKPTDVDDVASILHIYKMSGKVRFSAPIEKAGLKIEFYKAGKPVKSQAADGGLLDVSGIAEKASAARFSLQAADLDYLPLGGGEKGACRLQLTLELVSAGDRPLMSNGLGSGRDVPKTVFDFSHGGGSGAFPAEAASPTEVPLFYLLANTNEFIGASTPADVIAKNPKANIVIVSLWTPK